MALELSSSFSPIGLNGAIENKTAMKLGPGKEISTSFIAGAYKGLASVNKIDLQGNIY